ncbi:MAG: DNA polymerase III subunit delta' C-terminal domain-containing protein [Eubacteriales bacterium]
MNFRDIICPNAQIEGLERSIYSNKVIQSLIIEGQEGTGKKTLTNIYANALVCINDDEKPCGKCKGCTLFLSQNHPDIFEVSKEKKKSIGVEQIKELQKEAIIKPNESTKKVFIIHDAHSMTPQAQNALLKLIEEPPKYLSIILICENTMPLLETIKSRCSIVPMPYLSYENIMNELIKRGVDKDKAKIIAQGANGSLGKALSRDGGDYLKKREELLEIFFTLFNSKSKGYEAAASRKESAREMICLWQSVVRDALMIKNGEIDNIENIDKINKIESIAKSSDKEKLINQLEALCEAEKRIYYNSQYNLALDNLMTKI